LPGACDRHFGNRPIRCLTLLKRLAWAPGNPVAMPGVSTVIEQHWKYWSSVTFRSLPSRKARSHA
jgi:hypothetical protein